MAPAMVGGCGCSGAATLLVLCVPLLFLGLGGGASASSIDMSTLPADANSCSPAVGCERPPAELSYVPARLYPDAYVNPPGECTSWAAAIWPGHHGRGVTWSGDAWEWYANAALQGYAVSNAPSRGAIAVFERTGEDGGEWGHVAVVVGVSSQGMRITEMNRAGRFVVDERTVRLSDPHITGFISVPDDAFT